MRLLKLSYTDTNWELKDLQLKEVNLIVGKNSVGKSKTLATIDSLYRIIKQKEDINWGSKWNILFQIDSSNELTYKVETSEQKSTVILEEIFLNGECVLRRIGEESAEIKSFVTQDFSIVHPPANKLVLHVRRDVEEYPFLETIMNWAEAANGFSFANIIPKGNQLVYNHLRIAIDIPYLFSLLDDSNQKRVIEEFNSVGYSVADIQIVRDSKPLILEISELGLELKVPHNYLSQGMFRALALIIFMEYLITLKSPSTVIIDDLCEGLDYERATKLGKLIFNKCKNAEIQLIATSNDSFLMDVVGIEYWNILTREGKQVTAMNNETHPDLFRDFKFTGLSNFDFFASDFIVQKSS